MIVPLGFQQAERTGGRRSKGGHAAIPGCPGQWAPLLGSSRGLDTGIGFECPGREDSMIRNRGVYTGLPQSRIHVGAPPATEFYRQWKGLAFDSRRRTREINPLNTAQTGRRCADAAGRSLRPRPELSSSSSLDEAESARGVDTLWDQEYAEFLTGTDRFEIRRSGWDWGADWSGVDSVGGWDLHRKPDPVRRKGRAIFQMFHGDSWRPLLVCPRIMRSCGRGREEMGMKSSTW